MSNPLITVQSALYGAPGSQVANVTEAAQKIFDDQYAADRNRSSFTLTRIGAALFGVPNLPGVTRTFTILYSFPDGTAGRIFMRAGADGDNLILVVAPERRITVVRAVYATNTRGLDVAAQLNRYLSDPGNNATLIPGTPEFFAGITGGADPSPGIQKFFSASFTSSPGEEVKHVCGFDGQQVTLT